MYWCEKIWRALLAAQQQQRLPHALLFLGATGMGKQELAQQWAHYLLCSAPRKHEYACGQCVDCLLFQAQTHGDFYWIGRDKTAAIGVDDIRAMQKNAYQTAQRGQAKIFFIASAENMTLPATNALLKVLEEPPMHCYFILTSTTQRALPATVFSRCQAYRFAATISPAMEAWLATATQAQYSLPLLRIALFLASGAPWLAKQWLESGKVEAYLPFATALQDYFQHQVDTFFVYECAQGKPLAELLTIGYIVCHALLKNLKNPTSSNRKALHTWLKKIIYLQELLASRIALNEALLLDFLLAME